MSERYLSVRPAPHIRSDSSTGRIMLDVLLALIPVLIVGTSVFGLRALAVCGVSMLSCIVCEALCCLLLKKKIPAGDLSAAVTGLLLGLSLPVSIPLWQVAAGGFFAVVIVKQLFGGLGKNIFNPALAARAFLFCWPVSMTQYLLPDLLSGATPLHEMAMGRLPQASLPQMFLGGIGGSIGETSALALLVGGGYLLARRVIDWRIPAGMLGAVGLLTLLFPRGAGTALQWMLYSLYGGGLLLGAFFMATDYVSGPVLPRARLFYGIGCGALTVAIRYFGLYPEGVSYAILLMNAAAPLFDRLCGYVSFGKAGNKA